MMFATRIYARLYTIADVGVRRCAVLVCMIAGLVHSAHAAVICSGSVNLNPVTYSATSATIATGSVDVSCTRSSPAEVVNLAGNGYNVLAGIGSVSYNLGADGGNVGTTIAVSGINQLDYDLLRSPGFSSDWSTGSVMAGSVTFGLFDLTSNTSTTNFQMQVPTGRWTSPPGTYTELVTVFINHGTQTEQTTFTTTVQVNAACMFPVAPSDVNFGAYNSLASGVATTASSGFQVLCSQGVPISLVFDPASSSVLGLTYSLSLNPASGVVSLGSNTAFTINGSMAAGQAGTCNTAVCVGSQPRSITLSY